MVSGTEGLAFKPGLLIVALIGSAVSLRYVKDVTSVPSRIGVVASGASISYFSTPALVDYFSLVQGGNSAYGIAFAVGLFGLSLAAAIINQIPQLIADIRIKLGSKP